MSQIDKESLPKQIDHISMLGFNYTMSRTGDGEWVFLFRDTQRCHRVPWGPNLKELTNCGYAETFEECFNGMMENMKKRDHYCY